MAAPCERRISFQLGSDGEPQRACCGAESIVEAHKLALFGTFPAPHEGGCELRSVGGTESVCIRQAFGKRPDFLRWQDLIPRHTKLPKPRDRCAALILGHVAVANEPGEGTAGLQRRAPPDDDFASTHVAAGVPAHWPVGSSTTERSRSRPRTPRSDLVAVGT